MSDTYERVASLVSKSLSLEDLDKNFTKSMSEFGLDSYAYQIVEHNALQHMKNHVVTTYPLEWQKTYFQENYFDADPLVNKFKTSPSPFLWDASTFANENYRAKKMMSEARDFNLHNGVGIPIPGPNSSFSLVTLCSSALNEKDFKNLYGALYKDLVISALIYHSAFISLNLDAQLHHRFELTNTELETLKWVAAGKSDTVIADIAGVSVHAIKARLKGIYRKLEAGGRIEAVLKAFRYKIIE